MFEVFADLIGLQIAHEKCQWSTRGATAVEKENAAVLHDEFVAVSDHDLRNPLTAAKRIAELLICRKADPELVTTGKRLRQTLLKIADLVDDVMVFARGKFGNGIELSIQTVETPEVDLLAAIDELRIAHPLRNIWCDIAITSPVQVDMGRIKQLLTNLLSNALMHGAGDLPVSVHVTQDAGQLAIYVMNLDNPILEHLLGTVFEPRRKTSLSAPDEGLGLGLYICRQIVEAHGGTLEVRSSSEDGTIFTAHVPSSCDR